MTASKGHHHDGKWQAQIRVGGGVLTWGPRFDNPEDAAKVYDIMAIYLKGPDAKLNFDGRPPAYILLADVRKFLWDKGVLDPARQPWLDEPQQFFKSPLL